MQDVWEVVAVSVGRAVPRIPARMQASLLMGLEGGMFCWWSPAPPLKGEP